ncbi:MAG: hypothetical protein HOV86_14080, partial [Thermoactinospora sp.]|nr:hypothetical protein [Thermoactinospora sp.]
QVPEPPALQDSGAPESNTQADDLGQVGALGGQAGDLGGRPGGHGRPGKKSAEAGRGAGGPVTVPDRTVPLQDPGHAAADPGVVTNPDTAGRAEGLWNDPGLRLPSAAPPASAPSPAPQFLPAPLPREVNVTGKKTAQAAPISFADGWTGWPLVLGGVAALWAGCAAVSRREVLRIRRRAQAVS